MKKINIVLGVILTVFVFSCKKEGCTDEKALNFDEKAKKDDGSCLYPDTTNDEGTVVVQFNHVFGTSAAPFSLSQMYVHPKTGDSLTFSTFKYYISNLRFKKSDGTWFTVPDSYHLMCASGCTLLNKITVKDIPAGEYSELQYTFGVDSLRNVSGAQTGDLSVTAGMFWSWSSGYIMLKAEGMSPNSSNGGFAFHLGGFSGVNNIVTSLSTTFNGTPLTVSGGSTKTIHFNTNTARLWHSYPTIESVSVTSTVHMPGAIAKTMATDFATGILFDKIE